MKAGIIQARIIDFFNQTVASDSASQAFIRPIPERLCTNTSFVPCASPTVGGLAIVGAKEGVVAFSSLRIQAQPGCCTVLELRVPGLPPRYVDIQLDSCPPGQEPSRDNSRCEPCKQG